MLKRLLADRQPVAFLFALALGALFVPRMEAQVLGSVSAVGPAELRGVLINQEGTLFSNDSVNVPEGSYAKILLANGGKIEMGGGTRLTVLGEGQGTQVVMDSGILGFTGVSNQPIFMIVGSYYIVGGGQSVGEIEYLTDGLVSLEVMAGDTVVYDASESNVSVLRQGEGRELNLNQHNAEAADVRETLAVLATLTGSLTGIVLARQNVLPSTEGVRAPPLVRPVSVVSAARKGRGVRHKSIKSGKRASPSKPSEKSKKSKKSDKSGKSGKSSKGSGKPSAKL